MRRRARQGWLATLRRLSGVVVAAFAVVLAVGLARSHALALNAAEDTCVFMGGTALPRLQPADPSDLADHTHDCCDLGLCLDGGGALPPAAPAALAAPRRRALAPRAPRRAAPPLRPRPTASRPRAPPAR